MSLECCAGALGAGAVPTPCPSGPRSVPWHRDRAAVTGCHHRAWEALNHHLSHGDRANLLSEQSINGN